jgi:hypothetical protein
VSAVIIAFASSHRAFFNDMSLSDIFWVEGRGGVVSVVTLVSGGMLFDAVVISVKGGWVLPAGAVISIVRRR